MDLEGPSSSLFLSKANLLRTTPLLRDGAWTSGCSTKQLKLPLSVAGGWLLSPVYSHSFELERWWVWGGPDGLELWLIEIWDRKGLRKGNRKCYHSRGTLVWKSREPLLGFKGGAINTGISSENPGLQSTPPLFELHASLVLIPTPHSWHLKLPHQKGQQRAEMRILPRERTLVTLGIWQ